MATWTKKAGVSMNTAQVAGFYEFLPTGYNGVTLFPCIIFMHGSGERGNGNSQLDVILNFAVPKWINARMGTGNEFPYPCIVICPQYGTGVYPGRFLYENVITYILSNYAVDPYRIYLSGWSMGGSFMDEWGADTDAPTRIAALSPIAGVSYNNSFAVAKYKACNMPIWFLHGTHDSVIEWERSRDWITSLNGGTSISPVAKITYDPITNPRTTPPSTGGLQTGGDEHNIADHLTDWTLFSVSGQTWYQWMLAQTRGAGIQNISGAFVQSPNSPFPAVVTLGSISGALRIDIGGITQILNGQNWIGLPEANVIGGIFSTVMDIWGSDRTITGTTNQTIYKSCRRTSA
jgi:predicted peptidase